MDFHERVRFFGRSGLVFGAGVFIKEAVRGAVDFQYLSSICRPAIGEACGIISNDSAPNIIQASIYTVAMMSLIASVAPERIVNSEKAMMGLTAAAMFTGIIVGEIIPVATKGTEFNYFDVIAESIGVVPVLLALSKVANSNM